MWYRFFVFSFSLTLSFPFDIVVLLYSPSVLSVLPVMSHSYFVLVVAVADFHIEFSRRYANRYEPNNDRYLYFHMHNMKIYSQTLAQHKIKLS